MPARRKFTMPKHRSVVVCCNSVKGRQRLYFKDLYLIKRMRRCSTHCDRVSLSDFVIIYGVKRISNCHDVSFQVN